MDTLPIIVPDISIWQKTASDPTTLDFSQMYHAGARGVLIRAGYGTVPDVTFVDNWKRALDHYLVVLHYWYMVNDISPQAQLDAYIKVVSKTTLTYRYELDFEEEKAIKSSSQPGEYLEYMVKGIYTACGQYPTIYTGPTYYAKYGRKTEVMKNCPLHIAHWNVTKPMIPAPWTSCVLHQYRVMPQGYDFGVQSKDIDLSVWHSDLKGLHEFAGLPYKRENDMYIEERIEKLLAIHRY